MKWFRSISVAVPLLGIYGGFFCYFFAPNAWIWMFIAGYLFLVPLACFFFEALSYRKWKLSIVLSLTFFLSVLSFTDVQNPPVWFRTLGFYARTKLASDYISKCKLSNFVENDVTQTAGFCEGFDRGDYFERIVYDTTGEFVLPPPKRTAEWKKMMSSLTHAATVERDRTAYHLFGDYYAVVVFFDDLEG